ncbi:Hypothetical protein FORC25_1366 [Clostridium perfringens]|nr:Hypothetical protein FORC25_1366 [Clostridium perfringens]
MVIITKEITFLKFLILFLHFHLYKFLSYMKDSYLILFNDFNIYFLILLSTPYNL